MGNKSELDYVKVKGVTYVHYIDIGDDSTTFEVWNGNLLYKVDSSANVYSAEVRIGCFRTDNNSLWYFESLDGKTISTGNKSLLKAEMKVFKELVSREIP